MVDCLGQRFIRMVSHVYFVFWFVELHEFYQAPEKCDTNPVAAEGPVQY